MSAAPLRLGIIGNGRIASDYLRALQGSQDFSLIAICDSNRAALERAAGESAVQTFDQVQPLLLEAEPDAILVLTPPTSHAQISCEALAAGCHVFCEKPLATSSRSVHDMFHAAERAERVLMMATKFRFVDDVIAARDLLAAKTLGELVFFENAFCSPVSMAGRWNVDPRQSGGGVLIDNGSHSIDLARFLLGPMTRVSAHFGRRIQEIPVEDSVRILVEAQSGLVGQIDLSWSTDTGSDYYFCVHGAKGTLQLGWQGSRYRLHGGDWTSFGTGYDKIEAFTAQLRHFAGVVRGEESPQISIDDAIESVRFIEAGYASAGTGRWVHLGAPQERQVADG